MPDLFLRLLQDSRERSTEELASSLPQAQSFLSKLPYLATSPHEGASGGDSDLTMAAGPGPQSTGAAKELGGDAHEARSGGKFNPRKRRFNGGMAAQHMTGNKRQQMAARAGFQGHPQQRNWHNRKGKGNIKRHGKPVEAMPSLQAMQAANRAKTMQHFAKQHATPKETPGSVPRTVPRAPQNTTSFIMRSNVLGIHAPLTSPITPSVWQPLSIRHDYDNEWTSGYEGLQDDVAGLDIDLHGTMQGKIRKRGDEDVGSSPDDSRHQVYSDNDFGSDEPGDYHGFELVQSDIPVMQEQSRRIEALEEDNLTLRERVYLLEQELREMKQQRAEDRREVTEDDVVDSAEEP
eukprot:jgi/Chlat1/8909/Chrsp92S08221